MAASSSIRASATRFSAALVVSTALASELLIANSTAVSALTRERKANTSLGKGTLFDLTFGLPSFVSMGCRCSTGVALREVFALTFGVICLLIEGHVVGSQVEAKLELSLPPTTTTSTSWSRLHSDI